MALAVRDPLMATSASVAPGIREARRRAGSRPALRAGIGIAILLLAGSLVLAALLRIAMRLAGASAIADPLDLPSSAGAASPAATWGYVLFQSGLVPHPIPGTGWWTWGGGCLLLTLAAGGRAFLRARGGGRPVELLLLAAPSLLVGAAAGAAEALSDRQVLPLELAPLVAGAPLAGALLGAGWARLRQSRRAVPWLRALLAAAAAAPAGAAVAAIPILLLAPAGSAPGGSWILTLLPYVPNAVLRASFGGGLHPYALAGLAGFGVAAIATAVHLRSRSLSERAGFLAACALLLALATAAATPVSTAGQAAASFAAALPGAAAVGLLGAVLGPLLGSSAAGYRLSTLAVLQALGDRLPPPMAPELTARDMIEARPDTPSGSPAYVPAPGPAAPRLGRAVVVSASAVAVLSVLLVATVTFTGTAPEDSAPELRAARAYLDALASNDADRVWPTLYVDASGLPAGSPRLLSRNDLASLLRVTGNQHLRVSGVQLQVAGRSGRVTYVHAHYLEVGTPRDDTLALVSVAGAWKVLVLPAAISVGEVYRDGVRVDGTLVPLAPGQAVAVLPGVHSVEAGYPAPFLPGRVSVDAEEPYPVLTAARVPPRLDDGALASARAVVDAALRQCATSLAPRPAHCPQGVDSPGGEAVRWTLVGDPGAAATVGLEPDGSVAASGVFEMVGAYDVHVPEDVKHRASAGTFRLPLTFAGGAWSAAGDVVAGAGAARPPAADGDLLAAVRAGFQRCATSPLLRPADCPQTEPSEYFVKNVAWRLDSDPLGGAQGGYDAARGVLTVTGSYSMSVTYNEGGVEKSAQSSGRYRADLLWDGQRPVLVTIDRA